MRAETGQQHHRRQQRWTQWQQRCWVRYFAYTTHRKNQSQ